MLRDTDSWRLLRMLAMALSPCGVCVCADACGIDGASLCDRHHPTGTASLLSVNNPRTPTRQILIIETMKRVP